MADNNQQQTEQQQQSSNASTTAPTFDYDKLANIISGKLAVTEDSVLKGYFKQQGLSQDEMTQAINTFKQQKAAQTPDVQVLQQQMTQAQAEAQQMNIENKAILTAIELGIDSKTVPYVLKLADLSAVVGQDGKISDESVKNALNKVLEDVPQLKTSIEHTGFKQVGASTGGQKQENTTDEALKAAFGL